MDARATDPAADSTQDRRHGAWLCVLASGSSGNCTALVLDTPQRRFVYLIDLGLSPRRTGRDLASVGLSLNDVCGVLLTHLDSDHWNPAWIGKVPEHATMFMHKRHAGRAGRDGATFHRTRILDGPTELDGGAVVHASLHSHDQLGVSVFRFEFPGGGTLGFATDVGRITPPLIDHLRGVDVLAIESNYCPCLQADSERPAFLKDRITGGSGHLSNAQCAEAAARIAPRERVVLLHLSRQCNRPELALREHAGRSYTVTLTSQFEPTVPIALPAASFGRAAAPARRQGVLFEG